MATASAYFAADYSSARDKFLSASKRAGAQFETIRHPAHGPQGEFLYTDIALIGEPQAKKFLVLISGTHGVEGFAGSALQVGLLEQDIQSQLPRDTAVLMIHAINPYGIAHRRRFNEDNIDVNRNFRDHTKPPPQNPSYQEIAASIAPESISPVAEMTSWARILWFRLTAGRAKAKAVISGGQYTHPDGLFYGGTAETWSNTVLREIVQRYLRYTTEVVVIDIHTGFGDFGDAGIFPHIDKENVEYRRAMGIWGSSLIITTTSSSSANVHLGATVKTAIPEMLPETSVTAVTLEFGTFSQIDLLRALRAENWLHHHSDMSHPQAEEIKACLQRTYFPDSEKWNSMVWNQGKQVVRRALKHLHNAGSGQKPRSSLNSMAPLKTDKREVT
jgi:predicted deacylase